MKRTLLKVASLEPSQTRTTAKDELLVFTGTAMKSSVSQKHPDAKASYYLLTS
jgi:hypothetical protein